MEESLKDIWKQLSPDPLQDKETGGFKVNFKLGYFNSAAAKFYCRCIADGR